MSDTILNMHINELRQKVLREIEILRNGFRITGKSREVKVKPPYLNRDWRITTDALLGVLDAIESEVWNEETRNRLLAEGLTMDAGELPNFFWNSPFIGSGLDYLGTLSLYSDKTIIFDPIALFNKNGTDSPHVRPEPWINIIVNHALFIVSLEDWIKSGFVILLPRPAFWKPGVWDEMFRSEMPRLQEGGEQLLDRDFPETMAQSLFYDPPGLRESLFQKLREEGGKYSSQENEVVRKLREMDASNPAAFFQESLPDDSGRYGHMSVVGPGATFPEALWLQEQIGCFVGSSEQSVWDKIIYHAKNLLSDPATKKNAIIGRALTLTELEGLRKVEPGYALEIREKGALPAFRTFLRDSYGKIESADADHLSSVVQELRDGIKSHVQDLKGQWDEIHQSATRRTFFQLPAALIGGWAGVSHIVETQQFNIVVGSGVAAASYLGKQLSTIRNQKGALRRNPVYVLLKPQGRRYF